MPTVRDLWAFCNYTRRLMPTPSVPDLIRAGVEHHNAGRLAQAADFYQQVLRIEPNNFDALHLVGLIAHQNNRHDEAVDLMKRALAINPNISVAWFNYGNILVAAGEENLAVDAYSAAIRLEPSHPDAYVNLCNLLVKLNRFEESVPLRHHLVKLQPSEANNQFNLGYEMQKLGQLAKAAEAYRQALKLKPDLLGVHQNLAVVLQTLGRTDEAVAIHRQLWKEYPKLIDPGLHSNLLLTMQHADSITPQEIFAEHRKWSRVHAEPLIPAAKTVAPRHAGRIRIGYLSADFRTHPVAAFFEPILAHHNREQFEIFCYSNVIETDAVTAKLKSIAEHWRDIAAISDEAAVNQIREDKIDLLVDLSGHTAKHRLLIFARRPAAVSATYLGYPGSTGMTAIDYRITDALADPPELTDSLHTEKIFRLRRCFLCYQPAADAPPVGALPFESNGYITFGSFNHAGKITPTTTQLWGKVLAAVPGSRLVLKSLGMMDPERQAGFRADLGKLGIASDRIHILPLEKSYTAHLSRYGQLDIALETFPYHGTTTSCEALWMGVPVITLAGPTHVSRVGVSLLNAVGLAELIAYDSEEYIRIAATLAGEPVRLRELRSCLRERMTASPLLDAAGLARELEAGFQQMLSAAHA